MNYSFDETQLRDRLREMTMDEATLGSDEPDKRLSALATGRYALDDVESLEDILRVWRAASGAEAGFDFRFASDVSDEGFNSVMVIATGSSNRSEYREIPLSTWRGIELEMTDGVVEFAHTVKTRFSADE